MDVLPGLFDSISHHGPLARCADDARLFLAATQGPDDADILSIPGPLDLARPLDGDVRGMRFGLSIDLGCFTVDPEIAAAVTAAAERLAAAGAIVEEVDLRGRRGPRAGVGDAVGRVHGDLLRRRARARSASAWIPTSSR